LAGFAPRGVKEEPVFNSPVRFFFAAPSSMSETAAFFVVFSVDGAPASSVEDGARLVVLEVGGLVAMQGESSSGSEGKMAGFF
jgi:hypothetical protein